MVAGYFSDRYPPLPKPKPFHMTELYQERGIWCFWLTAEDAVLQFVQNLHCVLGPSANTPFYRPPRGRILISINPRYNEQEVWNWICDLLETEAQQVELNDSWEEAIHTAVEYEDNGF